MERRADDNMSGYLVFMSESGIIPSTQRAHKTQKHNLIIDQLPADNVITLLSKKVTSHFDSLF